MKSSRDTAIGCTLLVIVLILIVGGVWLITRASTPAPTAEPIATLYVAPYTPPTLTSISSMPTSEPVQATQTNTSVNVSTAAFGDFSFGRDGISNPDCRVTNEVTSFNQLDIANDQYLYFATPFQPADIGQVFNWSVTLSLCFWQGFSLTRGSTPGYYSLEVTLNGTAIYQRSFELQYTDPALLPTRPATRPLGSFTFGRDGLGDQCRISTQTTRVTQASLSQDEWLYFASSYTADQIGSALYWTVSGFDGSKIYDHVQDPLEDKNVLCFWQGFSFPSTMSVGTYVLDVEYQSNAVYHIAFTVK